MLPDMTESNLHILFFPDKPAAHFSQREDERVPLLSQRLSSGHCQTCVWQLADGWVAAPSKYPVFATGNGSWWRCSSSYINMCGPKVKAIKPSLGDPHISSSLIRQWFICDSHHYYFFIFPKASSIGLGRCRGCKTIIKGVCFDTRLSVMEYLNSPCLFNPSNAWAFQ